MPSSKDKDLEWEVANLRQSIERDWADLASKSLSGDRRKALIDHLSLCITSLKSLRDRLTHPNRDDLPPD
jgi:hypothetical protein